MKNIEMNLSRGLHHSIQILFPFRTQIGMCKYMYVSTYLSTYIRLQNKIVEKNYIFKYKYNLGE